MNLLISHGRSLVKLLCLQDVALAWMVAHLKGLLLKLSLLVIVR